MNLGIHAFKEHVMPKRYSPGIGLRPGAEFQSLEPLVAILFTAKYESVAHRRLGLNVIVVGHHRDYSVPRAILADCAQRLDRLPSFSLGSNAPLRSYGNDATSTMALHR
ncbi:MAG: hypothetical protein QGI49_02695 [SAR202 cluster bacterium]|nr:hypothetical protein [SAR202 cluster bacterium]